MIVRQTKAFKRKIKKLHKQEKLELDKAIKEVMANPSIGDKKKGDLKEIQVYKYKYKTQQYLLAYHFQDDELILTFIEYGQHENFYRDLKNSNLEVIR